MSKTLTIAHIAAEREFPHCSIYKPKANGGWEWDLPQLHHFYTSRGYYIYRTSIDRFVPIRVIDNIVKIVGKKELVDEILNFLLKVDESPPYIHQFALKKMPEAVSDDFLISLPEKQVEFRKDRKDAMQLYYQNCIVKITSKSITKHPYSDLTGYIWESQILPREYKLTEITDKGDWARFVSNICKGDERRTTSLCSALGFYLHNYKSPAYCPAIILNDEVMSDNPEGGTGKGLFFRAVAQFVKMFRIDGKIFSFDKNFVYQGVSADTKLIFFDDVKKNFDFERLFSVITEGITTEKKGRDEVYYDHENSPKVGIASNYGLRGAGNSHDRRKHELEITQYYTKKFRPDQEFGRMMFTGWDANQWLQFDNYMIMCCQLHLKLGLIEQELINLPIKKLLTATNSDFLKFMNEKNFDFEVNKSIIKSELIREFMDEFDDYIIPSKFFSKHMFTRWVTAYADFKGYTIGDYNDGVARYYTFIKKPQVE